MRRALAVALALACAPAVAAPELARWEHTAKRVTILRDNWGIPHVFGKSDADAVFGLLYAQAEDDFKRVELNYINALGRLAEVEGEAEVWRDLRMKLFISPKELQAQYAASPAWLKKLMVGFADGLNYYLHTHPDVKPKLITHFEPWMALAFSEGSIGGDIESVRLSGLEKLYGKQAPVLAEAPGVPEPKGSNGFAIGPKLSASGHAMLLINPHTSFYFRLEVHVVSEEGLNAYGAVTWGQFFIYQGFNEHAGWMHTSGGADVIDEYVETARGKDYFFDGKWRPMKAVPVSVPFKGGVKQITAYFTHHGPVVRELDGKWVSVKLMNSPLQALQQSYLRTKAADYAGFVKTMDLRTNSSNNTVYADAKGNIAYFHGNFVPKRDPQFDFTKPVDGSVRATDWQGLHPVSETITLLNPSNAWIQNTNNWPFTAAGANSPRVQDYPAYMWANPENARGLHALRVLKDAKALTLDGLIALAYDNYLSAFDMLIPALLKAYEAKPDPALAAQIAALRAWDLRSSVDSVPTSLAVYFAQALGEKAKTLAGLTELAAQPEALLAALTRASAKLSQDFGTWQTPWGEINRFQRLKGEVDQHYDDSAPSLPVGFASAYWGSLASFGMTGKQTTKRLYGDRGNSFVAVVEFGPRIKAKSILAGGVSGDPSSPHFQDQAEMYAKGQFKEVLFYREDIEKHVERRYHPGQR